MSTNFKARPSAESEDMINGKQFTELLASSELWTRGLTAQFKAWYSTRGRSLPSQHTDGKPENQTVFILRSEELGQM